MRKWYFSVSSFSSFCVCSQTSRTKWRSGGCAESEVIVETLCMTTVMHESFSVKCGWNEGLGSIMFHSTVGGGGGGLAVYRWWTVPFDTLVHLYNMLIRKVSSSTKAGRPRHKFYLHLDHWVKWEVCTCGPVWLWCWWWHCWRVARWVRKSWILWMRSASFPATVLCWRLSWDWWKVCWHVMSMFWNAVWMTLQANCKACKPRLSFLRYIVCDNLNESHRTWVESRLWVLTGYGGLKYNFSLLRKKIVKCYIWVKNLWKQLLVCGQMYQANHANISKSST